MWELRGIDAVTVNSARAAAFAPAGPYGLLHRSIGSIVITLSHGAQDNRVSAAP